MHLLDLIFPKNLYCISCGRPLPVQGAQAAQGMNAARGMNAAQGMDAVQGAQAAQGMNAARTAWAADSISLCECCSSEIGWIAGRSCAKCGRPLADENPMDFCRDCAGSAVPAGHKARFFGRGYACALYSGRAAGLVRELKYRGRAWYADTLSASMAARYLSLADAGTGELPWYDCLVAVPVSAGRKAARGFNQAVLLAEGISRRTGIPLLKGALKRVRETGVMSSLTEEERRQNLRGAFVANCDMMKKIGGKRILLVDDVCTTGSTADACAEALLAAHAVSVDFIVFAIGADVRRTKGRPAVVESPGQLRAKGPT